MIATVIGVALAAALAFLALVLLGVHGGELAILGVLVLAFVAVAARLVVVLRRRSRR